VPPVISLIALFFLYTAATYLVIFLMTAIAGFLAAGPPEVPIVFIGAILLLPIFLALLAGIGLLRGADWGHSAALFLAWLAVILGVLSILITPFARQFQLGVYPILLTGIARIVFYVYVIRFIHRYWPKQWVAVTS